MGQAAGAYLRPEVVAPLADAVRLVDRHQRQLAGPVQVGHRIEHARADQLLWGGVDQQIVTGEGPGLS